MAHHTKEEIALTLDLSGLQCPLPVLKTRKAMKDLDPGTLIEVLTTDPMAQIDMPHFATENGHEIVVSKPGEKQSVFVLRKG